MEVKIINGLAGRGRVFSPGEVADVPEPVARDWIRAGAAAPMERKAEAAMLKPQAEKAMRPAPVSRKAR